jgi:NAD-dependent dihydropyrimidine dehydrogenase PreA subunit
MWAFPISVIPLIPLLIWWRGLALPFLAVVWAVALLIFLGFPWIPSRAVVAPGRALPAWTRYLIVFDPRSQKVLLVWTMLVVGLTAYGRFVAGWPWMTIIGWGLAGLAVALLMSLDLAGSTPIYKSGLHEDRLLRVELDLGRCEGRAICEQVCPKNCYEIDSKLHKARILKDSECVQCGACIVQCPEDALAFVDPTGLRVPPEQIRKYKLNMTGQRVLSP